MNCCSNCFNDDFLAKQIDDLSTNLGKCDYCKSNNVKVLEEKKLSDYFYPLLGLYELSIQGNSLIELLNNDWLILTRLENDISEILIQNILEIEVNKTYVAKNNDNNKNILNWQEFKYELKHSNRYFPKKAPNYDHLKKLLEHLLIIFPKNQILYRARINEDNTTIDIINMGKPPEKISTAGRANPLGIPYLYLASNIKTAISEIRPHKGDKITVATFSVIETLKLVDLRNPRQTISPFALDDNALNQIFLDLDYLCHLGEELSKPILPREAQLEYLSTQYLCELIKHFGFDGVIYKSSMGDGDNFAVFYDDQLKAFKSDTFLINSININYTKDI